MLAPGREAFSTPPPSFRGKRHVAWNDTHHHRDHFPGFSGRFGGYGYGMGHSGMGIGGVILVVLLVLLLLGKL
jgi:hypothetical protein